MVHGLVEVETQDLGVEGRERPVLQSFQVFVERSSENVLMDRSHFL